MSNQLNSKMITCPKCRIQISALSKRCRNCGSKLPDYSIDILNDEAPKTSAFQQTETTDGMTDAPTGLTDSFQRFVRESND